MTDNDLTEKFLNRYQLIRLEGWEELADTSQPFQMVHKDHVGVYTVQEAYDLSYETVKAKIRK